MNSFQLFACALMGGVLAASSASTANGGSCCKDKQSTQTASAQAPNLQIYIDENGRRVTPQQAAPGAVLPSPAKPVARPEVSRSADGGLRMDGNFFQSASIATVTPSGKVEVNCVTTSGLGTGEIPQ